MTASTLVIPGFEAPPQPEPKAAAPSRARPSSAPILKMTTEHQRWIEAGRKWTTLRRKPLAPLVYRLVSSYGPSLGYARILPGPVELWAPPWDPSGRRERAFAKSLATPFFPAGGKASGALTSWPPDYIATLRDEQWHTAFMALLDRIMPGEGYSVAGVAEENIHGQLTGGFIEAARVLLRPAAYSSRLKAIAQAGEGSPRTAFLALLELWHPGWRLGQYPLWLHGLEWIGDTPQ